MKIPIYDKSNKWLVKFVPEVSDECGTLVAGLCDFTSKQITVSTSYPRQMSDKDIKDQISRTYWHEVMHAIFYECDIRDLSWFTGDNEHAIIAPLAKAMALLVPIEIELTRVK